MNFSEIVKNNNLTQSETNILNKIINWLHEGKYKIPIRDIAKTCYVSTTTVVRLAKKLGYDGYSEMLFDLKTNLNKKVDYNIIGSIRSVVLSEESLDIIEQLINDLSNKNYERIHVIGIGYSDYPAQYLCDKLLELDYFATTKSPLDFINNKKSIVLFISESGETTDLIFIAKKCQFLHYKTYALSTSANSTLCNLISNNIIIDRGRKMEKFPDYFIGNSINLIESILSILLAKKQGSEKK